MKFQQRFVSFGFVAALCLNAVVAQAQRGQPAGPPVVRGPFWSGTIRAPRGAGTDTIAMKGIAITLNAEKSAFVCFDTDLVRMSLAWTGQYLNFGNTLDQIAWPPPPQVSGTTAFGISTGPGWAKGGSVADPRKNQQGPLPKDWAHYSGIYVNGDQVVLKYTVGGVEILETPGFQKTDDQAVFTRTIQFTKGAKNQALVIATGVQGAAKSADFDGAGAPMTFELAGGKTLTVDGAVLPKGTKLNVSTNGVLTLQLGTVSANSPFRLALSNDPKPAGFAALKQAKPADLRPLMKGGVAKWTETTVTKGVRGTGDEAYVVDTITEPTQNAYNVKNFFGGFDFFPDGRAAICTFHGDVWIVTGLDDSLEKVTWKRFATGMFQPLGLKVVNNTIYVLGRDQITRLSDLNNDGEADYYENFNNDIIVTSNYHEFCLDLQTDRAGNFYFAKGSPWEPVVTSPHQGCMFKLSKDGSKLEIIATGLRAPNGMMVGPHDEITVSDNQGHWMPASKLDWIEKGGFYGMTPAAQKEITMTINGTNFTANPSDPLVREKYKFAFWEDKTKADAASPVPLTYNKPISWVPYGMDNSSGGQVWATGDKLGPLKDHLLFMSYGKCTLFEVMLDQVDGVRQAAMVQLPLKFASGLMRGRVNPKDGQIYVSGLKGWQTSAARDGGFYRVRYTGKTVHLPTGFKTLSDGVQITFPAPMNLKSAADVGNYNVEEWNYHYTGSYGSPEFSVANPNAKQHDNLKVTSAKVSADGKTVTLAIADLKPADQIKVQFNLDAADGKAVAHDIYATIYKIPASKK